MINKVQPINNTLDYWHKYRPWAHNYLKRYTNDKDLHGNLDSELWFLLVRILNNVKDYKSLSSYIRESIKGVAKRIKDRLGYKYYKQDMLIGDDLLAIVGKDHLNITLDEYLEREALLKYINKLPSKQAIIIKKCFGIAPFKKSTMVDIAKEMNCWAPNIRYNRESALKKLRSMMNFDNIYNVKDFIYGKEQEN